jgi:hypothetical protein
VERRVKRLADVVNEKDFVGNGDTYHKREPFHSPGNISKLVRYSGKPNHKPSARFKRTIQTIVYIAGTDHMNTARMNTRTIH